MSEEAEKQARIEAFVQGKVPVTLHKGKLIVLVGSWVIFILIGIIALIDLYGPQAATIAWITAMIAAELWIPILIFIIIAAGTAIGIVLLILRLLRNHAYGLLKWSIIIQTALIWVLAIVIIVLTGFHWGSIFPLIMGIASTVLAILYFTIWKMRLELAAGILGLTGQVTHEEKELLVPGILKVFFIGILSAFGLIISLDIIAYTVPTAGAEWFHFVPVGIFYFGLFFYLYINIYFFNAIIYAITYIWYRKKDPKFHDGLAIATYQLPDIAVFAVFSAVIKFVRMLLRIAALKSKSKSGWSGGGGFRLADGILGTVWMYVNYFTLPSIVVEDVPTTTAIKRSVHRLFDNWVDVLLKEWGVGSVFGTLQLLIVLLFALGGGLLGFVITVVMFPAAQFFDWILIMVIIGVILFILVSMIVSKPLLGLFNDVYLTFLFGFVIDKESNFKYENNLPKELMDKLQEWFKSHPMVLRCGKCFGKVPEGVTSCPKCKAPYP
ncbi:MAG: hypothetical protein HWN65_03910 [Candidatus Helarchaeota archaeon]|nr:hypothetical protein [Candidatus Helarchaeota archaeon]